MSFVIGKREVRNLRTFVSSCLVIEFLKKQIPLWKSVLHNTCHFKKIDSSISILLVTSTDFENYMVSLC